jgi:hypothetical protein
MKIVRTAKSIVTSSIKRSLTIVLVKVIVATGLISLITNYAFGQESIPHIYSIDQVIIKEVPATKNLADYSLKTDWSNDIPRKVQIEYSIDFENQTLRKKVGNNITSREFTRLDTSESEFEFIISFEDENYDTVTLYLNEGEINDPYNFTELRPYFLEINSTSSTVLAYTSFSY